MLTAVAAVAVTHMRSFGETPVVPFGDDFKHPGEVVIEADIGAQ